MTITGTFEVTMAPLTPAPEGQHGMAMAHLGLDKTFHGPLSANSRGHMLSVRTPTEGSAGYVALEQVEGSLEGREGSFVLQHFGLMSAAGQELRLEVVPDSGTGDLTGLSGTMAIRIEGGQHHYDFDYVVP